MNMLKMVEELPDLRKTDQIELEYHMIGPEYDLIPDHPQQLD